MSSFKTVEGRRPIVKNKKYAPATGIQSDFEKILTTFVETKSVRYEEFAKLWREKKLSLIWAGRQTDREAVEFMEECMKVALKMFLPPYGFQARVGALYLLYGLYITQPCVPKVKIRVTKANWLEIKALQTELEKQNHHDSNFILNKLLAEGAFHFCAVSEQPRGRYSLTEDSNRSLADALREDRQSIDNLFTNEIFEQLDLIHRQYHQQKVQLAGPDASRPDRSLDVLQEQFPKSIKDHIQKHHERWKKKESTMQGRVKKSLPTIAEHGESVESDIDYQPGSSVGERRARLKAIAFRGGKTKQRYKHRNIVTEASSSSPEKNSPRKRGRAHKTGVHRSGAGGQNNAVNPPTTGPDNSSDSEDRGVTSSASRPLYHMPVLAEEPEPDVKPGRKLKRETEVPRSESCSSPKKSKRQAEAIATKEQQSREQKPSSSPRKRGRPPKAISSSQEKARPVGRPKKSAQGQPAKGASTSSKVPKSRVAPLNVNSYGTKRRK